MSPKIDTEARSLFLREKRAVTSPEGHSYWIDPSRETVWALDAGRDPSWQKCGGYAGPASVALWRELEAHRSALAEVESMLRAYGDYGPGGITCSWENRDKLIALADRLASVRRTDTAAVERERDAALAEVKMLSEKLAAIRSLLP